MTPSAVPVRRRRGTPVVLAVPAVSIVLLVLGWTALWLFARQEAIRVLDHLIAREQAQGRDWTCPGRTIEGFPLRVVLTCAQPSFEGEFAGADITGRLESLRAEALLYLPSAVVVSAEGPLAVGFGDGRPELTLAWSTLRLTIRGVTGDLKRALLEIDGLASTGAEDFDGSAERVELHVRSAPGRALQDRAVDVHLVAKGVANGTFDTLTGSATPADLDVSAVVTQARLGGTVAAAVEAWRAAGGTVEVAAASLVKGELRASVTGSVGIDAAHRPAGRLQAGLSGYETDAERLGIPPRALTIGNVLAGLLAPKPGAPTPGAPQPALRLPVVIEDGRVLVGPFKTGLRLRPLY